MHAGLLSVRCKANHRTCKLQVVAQPFLAVLSRAEYVLSSPFCQSSDAIHLKIALNLPCAVWPFDLDPIHFCRAAQAEVQPQIVLREVAAATPDLIQLCMTVCC